MIEMGIIVGVGLLVSFAKLGWRNRIRMLSSPMVVDVAVFVLLLFLHWGTYSGVMVATIGALFCSLVLSGLRWLFGYVANGKYIPGKFYVKQVAACYPS